MKFIDIIKNQLESEGHTVKKNQIGDERLLLTVSSRSLLQTGVENMMIFFNIKGEKMKEVSAVVSQQE
ncbi:hypothetical protein [Aquimarina megaterium]|uniref:hypothetical protein n=1 Tax=Aquimarina megaterium TaxID=1443666 RepID=UPI00094577C0|nr:hypothetical protein [Aquimarina megaterium]